MTKTKATYDYQPYPKHDGYRGGCKVGWYYYKNRADADAASLAAQHNASIQEQLGYDFGYQSPGIVRTMKNDGSEYAGLYEVCIP